MVKVLAEQCGDILALFIYDIQPDGLVLVYHNIESGPDALIDLDGTFTGFAILDEHADG